MNNNENIVNAWIQIRSSSVAKDELSVYVQSRWIDYGKYIKIALQLIAHAIGNNDTFSGYDYIVQHLENRSSTNYNTHGAHGGDSDKHTKQRKIGGGARLAAGVSGMRMGSGFGDASKYNNINDSLLLKSKNKEYKQLLDKVSLEITVGKGIEYFKAKKANEAINVFKTLESGHNNNNNNTLLRFSCEQ